MELRKLRSHQNHCEHKPDDWANLSDEEDEGDAPHSPIKVQGEKHLLPERAEPDPQAEYILEMHPMFGELKNSPSARREFKGAAVAAVERYPRSPKDMEERDRLLALQLQRQEQERLHRRASSEQPQGQPQGQPQHAPKPNAAWGEPLVMHQPINLAPAEGAFDNVYQVEGQEVGGEDIMRSPKKRRCNDKAWCCFCCMFWIILLGIGAFILIEGGLSQTRDAIGL
jgi:hypothetical protein